MSLWACNFLNDTMNLWDDKVWNYIIQIGILAITLLVANSIRRKVGFIRNSLLPTTVIGGILLLLFKFIPSFEKIIDKDFMEMVTYHALGLGFVSMSLKIAENRKKDRNKFVIMDTGLVTVNTYLVQALVGLGITLVMSLTVMPDLYSASGILLPLGYGQGPGQALNFGKVFESAGFEGGATFGLSIAAIGFLFACIVGVIYLNVLNRKNKLSRTREGYESTTLDSNEIFSPNEVPLTEAIDKLTLQIAIVISIYIAAYLVIRVGSDLAVKYLGDFGVNTIRPLLYGFNFLFGVIFAVAAKGILSILRKTKLMNRQYPSNFLLNRISGFMFDIMIISGICAIELEDIGSLFIPLAIICSVGGIVTMIYLRFVCNRIYPDYSNEAFFSMFGMLTGTASTGMILLREIDPKYETPASNNLVFQSIPALLFGFPILLLIPLSDDSTLWGFIVLGIVLLLFIVYNVILFRTFIFKRKSKNK